MLETATELDVIRDADIDGAYEREGHKTRVANVQSLPYHHQVLYALIHNAGACMGQALHDATTLWPSVCTKISRRYPSGSRHVGRSSPNSRTTI
ncbi:hypothetical protein HLRTI_002321 [Halorhabdus tiamatea SARL4B]|uniref:Uncharacterized protein n=1 Tax=Halorhabdus tiamatea SARL4B TaxID=1033806 RepID=U2FB96_9EURY|nr:hypothetical protein HLRTI_002321 [Halorhabdus tiamatea SARL4B]